MRTFNLNDSERGTIPIKVTRSTVFERMRSNGRWVATRAERSGGGGNHGGGD